MLPVKCLLGGATPGFSAALHPASLLSPVTLPPFRPPELSSASRKYVTGALAVGGAEVGPERKCFRARAPSYPWRTDSLQRPLGERRTGPALCSFALCPSQQSTGTCGSLSFSRGSGKNQGRAEGLRESPFLCSYPLWILDDLS